MEQRHNPLTLMSTTSPQLQKNLRGLSDGSGLIMMQWSHSEQ
jgi:hypothetical protein